jgi:murein DD-endopeptidase MepM/ murein hydrolase activator NlpD
LLKDPSHPPVPEGDGHGVSTRWRDALLCGRSRRIVRGLAALLLIVSAWAIERYWEQSKPKSWMQGKTTTAGSHSAASLPKFKEIVGSFHKNQTMTEVLLQQGISISTVNRIVESARPVYNLAKVKASRLYWLCFTQDGKFCNLRYPVDDERYLTVYHDDSQDRFVPIMKNYQFETRVEHVSSKIESSLFASIVEIGETFELAMDLADIFGSDIDFNTDIQRGDSFQALVEKKYLDGKFVKNGAILAASVSNQAKLLTGFRFTDENGKPAYYAPEGRALKRSFLKAPLKIIRITSRFSKARFHPILKIVRPHLGVDYAAPAGTPVQAVAAGTVVGAGDSGGSGKMVRLRHAGGFESQYLHLSKISVKSGAPVDQGAIIGHVGSSGLSTGPHLDFRLKRNGSAINPSKVIFPPGKPVAPGQFSRFAELRDGLMKSLAKQDTNGQVARAESK